MSSFGNFYANLFRKINKEYHPKLYKDLQIGIKDDKIEFIMAFMGHVAGYDMCYIGYEGEYIFLPFSDYLKNLLEGNVCFVHTFIRFQDIVHFPGVDSPLRDIINSIYDENNNITTVKKKSGKIDMLISDIEYLENEMKFIDILSKHPHSDVMSKNYKGKAQKYIVKEKKKLNIKPEYLE